MIGHTLRTLETGEFFRFTTDGHSAGTWEYRGNGWFGKPYSGGPYHCYGNPPVTRINPDAVCKSCFGPLDVWGCVCNCKAVLA